MRACSANVQCRGARVRVNLNITRGVIEEFKSGHDRRITLIEAKDDPAFKGRNLTSRGSFAPLPLLLLRDGQGFLLRFTGMLFLRCCS